jgi:hypothetical protein
MIYINTKLKNENSEIKADLKYNKEIKYEYKNIKEILLKFRKEINIKYNKLIDNNNYNKHKLDEIMNSKTKSEDKKKDLIFITNNYSTLKSQYFKRFEKIYAKYRNETELSFENKNKYKQYLLNGFSSLFKKIYKKIDVIILNKKMHFGNAILVLNNLIYFCEILSCKQIYLSKHYWFVKKKIYDKELNITISPFTKGTWNNQSTIYINSNSNIFQLFKNNYIPVRTYILKNEILSNLKLIDTKIEDLYINIRSGKDIFKNHVPFSSLYIQPLLCFYKTIIEMFIFSNIYIISNGKENPVVNELLESYKK